MKMNKQRKGYAYGSMVRKPMYGGGNVMTTMSANPMMPKEDKMGMNNIKRTDQPFPALPRQ